MKKVVSNITGLTVLEQIAKGQDIITKSTNNAKAPGNADELAEVVAAQSALVTANAACDAAKQTCKGKTADRTAALRVWKTKLNALAATTQRITEGEEGAVLSTGFDLKADPLPPQELGAPQNLRAATNGTPGMSKLRWEPLVGAVSYLVEHCPDPIAEDKWEQIATPTKASCVVDGAEPGKKRWYRVAGVNTLGQGPWSEPESRPVM